MTDHGKATDSMLDKISELTHKRDSTIRTCEAFKESSPEELGEVMDFIIVGLR
jgi:hypothetical protein